MSRFKPLFILFFSCLLSVLSHAQRLTLEEAVRKQFTTFAPETLDQLAFIPGTDTWFYVKDDKLMSGDSKGEMKQLLSLDDLNRLLGPKSIKRFPEITWISPTAFYFQRERQFVFVDLATTTAEFTAEYPEQAENIELHPATKRIAYTILNDLYVIDQKEIRITNFPANIVSGQIISRNEYGINKGIFWSPDGSKLAFYQKDESNVQDYPLTNYSTVPAKVKNIKYPMAGSLSEMVKVGVYDIGSASTIYLDLNYQQNDDKFYATNLSWQPAGKQILIAWLNRTTNIMQLKSFDAATGTELKILLTEKDDRWLEPLHPAEFIPFHQDEFLWFSNQKGFTQLYRYHISGLLLGNTKNEFEILSVIGYDARASRAYVLATGEKPTEVHAYEIVLADMSMKQITTEPGMHQVSVGVSGKTFVDSFSNVQVPGNCNLRNFKGEVIKNLLTAENPYKGRTIGITEMVEFPSNTGETLYARVIKPSNFDPNKKYPVVVYVYNGPHVQLVTNSWLGGAALWMHYLAEDGYVVFTVDGHGSEHRGKKFEQAVYRQLGTQEIEDQITGVEWLKKQPWVDANRMGIHGWSFGGFMTTSLMLRKPGTFKAAVAGGAVIDWRLYEVMYTERYMDTPAENPDGYKTADVTNYVKNLQGKLLMIHGTDDNVVVYQHAMKFLKACVDNGVQVDFFAYPGHEHNVRGVDRVHLMKKIIDYLEANI
jgi:dipeptidyl-peptidase-4